MAEHYNVHNAIDCYIHSHQMAAADGSIIEKCRGTNSRDSPMKLIYWQRKPTNLVKLCTKRNHVHPLFNFWGVYKNIFTATNSDGIERWRLRPLHVFWWRSFRISAGYHLSWLRVFVVFFSTSGKMSGYYHDWLQWLPSKLIPVYDYHHFTIQLYSMTTDSIIK
jgi:hypothetical protein